MRFQVLCLAADSPSRCLTWHRLWLQVPTTNTAYIFINEGDVYTDANQTQYSYVSCINTITQAVSDVPFAPMLLLSCVWCRSADMTRTRELSAS